MFFKKKSAQSQKDPEKKKQSIITGLIVGGAIGSVMSLLFAPNSGKKTRAKVAKKGKAVLEEGKSQAAKFLDKYQKKVKDEIAED